MASLSKLSSQQRRTMAATIAQFKPGEDVVLNKPEVGWHKPVRVEYVDLCYVTAKGEYPLEDFREPAFEYGLMELNERGFATRRIRVRSSELARPDSRKPRGSRGTQGYPSNH